MDLKALDLPITLRLWHAAGLELILSDEETVEAAFSETPVDSRSVIPAVPANSMTSAVPVPPRVTPSQIEPTKSAPEQKIAKQYHGKVNLPPELQKYFSHIRVPAFSLWTYWEFPVDLSASPDRARQTLLKKILRVLGWPKGSSIFWPISRMEKDKLVPDLELFTYGLQVITPVYVFCFGKKGSNLLVPNQDFTTLKRFTSQYTSIPVQVLPGLDEMLPDNKKAKSIAWKILKGYTPLPM